MGCVIKLLSLPNCFSEKRGKKLAQRKVSYHVHLKDAGPPAPDEQMIIPLLALTSFDADKVALYPPIAHQIYWLEEHPIAIEHDAELTTNTFIAHWRPHAARSYQHPRCSFPQQRTGTPPNAGFLIGRQGV
jgi:hypothetical protein